MAATQIQEQAEKFIQEYKSQNIDNARAILFSIYHLVKSDPSELNILSNYNSVGIAFLTMIIEKISNDQDVNQMIASVGYLCLSKAIENDQGNIDLYKNRLLLLQIAHKPLIYTIILGLKINAHPLTSDGAYAPIRARDEIYKMEISDLESLPMLYEEFPIFRERKAYFSSLQQDEHFGKKLTLIELINQGKINHNILSNYLNFRILVENDIDF